MSEVLDKVPLDRETKAVLLGESSMLRPVCQLMLARRSGKRSVAWRRASTSIMGRLPAFMGRLNSGPAKSALVHDRLFSIAERDFPVSRGRCRTCGNVLLCKTLPALPLALSGANEYH